MRLDSEMPVNAPHPPVQANNGQQPDQHHWQGSPEFLKKLFDEMDTNHDGSLDHEEIAAALGPRVGRRVNRQHIAAAISAMDANKDGEVSFEEFAAWWNNNGGLDLYALFQEIDANGNGTLCISEVDTLCKKLGKDLSPTELESAMARMDYDGSGEVDWAEFNKWWADNAGVRRHLRHSAFTAKLLLRLGLTLNN